MMHRLIVLAGIAVASSLADPTAQTRTAPENARSFSERS